MNRYSGKLFEKIAFLVFCVFCCVTLIILQLEKNDLREETKKLNAQIAELNDYADELQATLDRPFDDAYIAEIAKEKLGLRFPQEVVIYSKDYTE